MLQGEVVAFGGDESMEWGLQSPDSVTQWFLVREMGMMTSLEVGKRRIPSLSPELLIDSAGVDKPASIPFLVYGCCRISTLRRAG